jgi:hypothetical protein
MGNIPLILHNWLELSQGMAQDCRMAAFDVEQNSVCIASLMYKIINP